MQRFSYKNMCRKKFRNKVKLINENLVALLGEARKLNGYAMTKEEEELANNLTIAIDNALDISSTENYG